MRGSRGGSSARCIMLVGLGWSSSIWCGAEPASAAKRPIAIVAYVSGTAECLPRGAASPRAIGLFDLLTEGTELRTDAGSTLRLAFASGSLYELAESGRALVAPDGFTSCRGSCRLVSRSTATDLLSVILSKNGHTTAAAIRIRGSCLSDLVSLPDPVIIRLAPWIEAGAHQRWQLAIRDQEMRDVFATDVASSADVTIPAGTLRAGAEYVWSLHAIDEGKRTAIVEQKSLRILGMDEARLRKGMRSSYDATKEVSWLLLLAGWDADVGLVCGACGELREALRQTGENAPIREKLTALACRE